jgi:hypothetical protein
MADKNDDGFDSFFPEGYEAPKETGGFMKLEDGDNKFRILSPLVTGYEYWTAENKPVRAKETWDTVPDDIKKGQDGKPTAIKFFWNVLVYSYASGGIQSLEITQKTIQKALTTLIDNPEWGNPKGYDVTVNKVGKGLETKYSVVPNPHSDMKPEVAAALEANTMTAGDIFKD